MEDNLNIQVEGVYLGVNSNNGVGTNNARIFLFKYKKNIFRKWRTLA